MNSKARGSIPNPSVRSKVTSLRPCVELTVRNIINLVKVTNNYNDDNLAKNKVNFQSIATSKLSYV